MKPDQEVAHGTSERLPAFGGVALFGTPFQEHRQLALPFFVYPWLGNAPALFKKLSETDRASHYGT
ncbi:MAG: hypothetical protein OXU75_17970 [Deltaproteobacteria bacterium]|nr:hypothetical protein [Deltaproteobacteria bacterium]